jgi:hypothetical protein
MSNSDSSTPPGVVLGEEKGGGEDGVLRKEATSKSAATATATAATTTSTGNEKNTTTSTTAATTTINDDNNDEKDDMSDSHTTNTNTNTNTNNIKDDNTGLSSSSTFKLLPIGYKLGDDDVICGRGSRCFNHTGNKKFRTIVEKYLHQYSTTNCKFDKTSIICDIVAIVRKNSPNGGFVKKDPKTGRYYEVGDFLAVRYYLTCFFFKKKKRRKEKM